MNVWTDGLLLSQCCYACFIGLGTKGDEMIATIWLYLEYSCITDTMVLGYK